MFTRLILCLLLIIHFPSTPPLGLLHPNCIVHLAYHAREDPLGHSRRSPVFHLPLTQSEMVKMLIAQHQEWSSQSQFSNCGQISLASKAAQQSNRHPFPYYCTLVLHLHVRDGFTYHIPGLSGLSSRFQMHRNPARTMAATIVTLVRSIQHPHIFMICQHRGHRGPLAGTGLCIQL